MWKLSVIKSYLLLQCIEFKESLPLCCTVFSKWVAGGGLFEHNLLSMWWTECEDLQKLPVEGSTSPFSASFRSGSQQAWSISIFITEMERNELEEWGQGARQVRSRTHHVFSSLLILSIIFALPPSCSQGLWVEWRDPKKQDSLEDISSSDLTTLHFTALQTVTWSLG